MRDAMRGAVLGAAPTVRWARRRVGRESAAAAAAAAAAAVDACLALLVVLLQLRAARRRGEGGGGVGARRQRVGRRAVIPGEMEGRRRSWKVRWEANGRPV